MTIEIVMPKIGLNMEEGIIVEWIKKTGDEIKRGDVLFILETDKVTVESEAQQEGKLVKILVPEGERVPVKTPVALMIIEGEDYVDERETPAEIPSLPAHPKLDLPYNIPPAQLNSRKYFASPKAKYYARQEGLDLDRVAADVEGIVKFEHVIKYARSAQTLQRPLAVTPLAKRIAKDEGVDLATVIGSGVSGKITRQDVEDALKSQVGAQPPLIARKSAAMKGVRALIAERMLHSSQITAPVTLHSEVDITGIVEFRQSIKESGVSIVPGYNAILISLVAKALEAHPVMNSRNDGETVTSNVEINIGLAVDHPDGLRVVVVRNANEKTFARIQVDLVEMIGRVQSNTSTADDLSGGTFTITNLGAYGIDQFTPIINPPETGILGVGRITEKLVLKDGKIAQRSMMTLSLTFDHRVIDGAACCSIYTYGCFAD